MGTSSVMLPDYFVLEFVYDNDLIICVMVGIVGFQDERY